MGIEVILHGDPFPLVPEFPAPATDVDEFLEVMETVEQWFGREVHPRPNDEDRAGAEEHAVPVEAGVFFEEKVWNLKEFHEPAKGHDREKTQPSPA